MPPAFLELASVLVLSTFFGIIAKLLHQPLILAYIFAGIVISLLGIFKITDKAVFDLLANLGIAFLLFLVGVELRLEDLKSVGRAALFTGLGQIIFTALVGFVILGALGFSVVASIYIAVAITFSSTVIIVKLLSEKHDLQSLYGKIAVGFLLVQDFVAILALMFLSGFGGGQVPSILGVLWILLKGAFLVALAYLASRYLLRYLFMVTSLSTELLFVSATAWAFAFAVLASLVGFSIAIGAFLAGVSIASSPYSIQISARVKPLRDFFTIIFFILLGASMSLGASNVKVFDVIVLSLFVLVGNPLIVIAIMLTLGFRNRTSFLASVTVAQISEFSLILMTVGQNLGHVTYQMVSLVSAVGIVTITLSSYLILYGDKIYHFLEKPFFRFFREKNRDPYVLNRESLRDHTILVGGEQMGWDILEFLARRYKDKKQIMVVDFNPDIVNSITASGYMSVFGDISDPEVLEELEFAKARLVVITDPDVGDNVHLIRFAKEKGYKGPVITTAYWIHDAIKLYEAGADYVVVPETIGGKHVAKILGEFWDDLSQIKKRKSKNFEELLAHRIF